ncbi:hypothetical protein H0H93_004933 [Arthromyces matolae]|nr:hypothetical protein H0H93_004933 [Arthromyces matolae]
MQQRVSSNNLSHSISLQSDLLALTDLNPPSPILGPAGAELEVSVSFSKLPIEFNFTLDLTEDACLDIGRLKLDESHSISSPAGLHLSSNFEERCWQPGMFPKIYPDPTSVSLDLPAKKRVDDLDYKRSDTHRKYAPVVLQPELTQAGSILSLSATSTQSHSSDAVVRPARAKTISRASLYQPVTTTELISGQHHDCLSSIDSCHVSMRRSQRLHRSALDDEDYQATDAPVDTRARRLAVATTLATLENRYHLEHSTPKCGVVNHGVSTKFNAETVELMIDQEGFRRVLARFKHVGHSTGSSFGTSMAQFRPIRRQAFYFHYASLEPLPVLRRITVNGDETRDYISRQASLGLKTNGVYFVQGSETLSFSHVGEDAQFSKLSWRFEYLVDDRRSDVSGKHTLDGEKILTPLSFSCSPILLHPLQGKQVRLMHIMRKTVIPKLGAEKMEPPSFRPGVERQWDRVEEKSPSDFFPCATIGRCKLDDRRGATPWIPSGNGEPTPFLGVWPKFSPNRGRRTSSVEEQTRPIVTALTENLPSARR